MKVKVQDFQMLKGEHNFEFPEGITIIQGKNASGKSSLFYAIKNCLTNPSGVDYCINHEAKNCSVTIENNNNSVTWIKTRTSSEYVNNITKQNYVKASKLDSRDIADLGFYFDPKGNIVNIHDEWSILFPFGQTETEMFRLFEDIFNISCSFSIVDEIKKDEQNKRTEISSINKQIDNCVLQKQNIEKILDKINLKELNKFKQDLQNKQQISLMLQEDFTTLSKNYQYQNVNIPKQLDIADLLNNHSYFNQIKKDYDNYGINNKYIELKLPEVKVFNLTEPIILKDFKNLEEVQKELINLKDQLQKLEEDKVNIYKRLSEIKVCPTCGQLLQMKEQL